MRVLLVALALLVAPASHAAAPCTGCSLVGARVHADTTDDRIFIWGDIQVESLCGRWPGFLTECRDAQLARATETIESIGGIDSVDLAVTLGDMTNDRTTQQREAFRAWYRGFTAAQREKILFTWGNHDQGSTFCDDLTAALDDAWLEEALDGQVERPLYWQHQLRHTTIYGLPMTMLGSYYATPCIDQGATNTGDVPRCYGVDAGVGAGDRFDTCAADSECKSGKCFIGPDAYTDFREWFALWWTENQSNPRDKAALIVGHKALCLAGATSDCSDTVEFKTVQNIKACASAPDTGIICGTGNGAHYCPTNGAPDCTEEFPGYETRDWLISTLTDSRDVIAWAFGHVGAELIANAAETDILGSTDFWPMAISGPTGTPHDNGFSKQAGLVTVDATGVMTVDYIETTNAAPAITVPASQGGISASTPTPITLTATDADYGELTWGATGAQVGVCITFAADTNGTGFQSDVEATLTVDCAAAVYTVDVTLTDGISADDQALEMTITVDP